VHGRARRVLKSHVRALHTAGGIGAARNLGALKSLAITHVVNASPIVPCFHAACLRYRTVAVFDDPGEDIAQFFEATNRWISKVCDWAALRASHAHPPSAVRADNHNTHSSGHCTFSALYCNEHEAMFGARC